MLASRPTAGKKSAPLSIEPYKSMPVIYAAIGGSDYAAMITDVRPEGVSLVTFPPGGAFTHVTRVPFESSRQHLRPTVARPFCYFVQPPRDGFSPPEPTVAE